MGDGTDCTFTRRHRVYESCSVGESKYLYNSVHENLKEKAALFFDPGNGHHNFIKILWSPDSI